MGLPEPVQGYLKASIKSGTPLAVSTRIVDERQHQDRPMAPFPRTSADHPASGIHMGGPGGRAHLGIGSLRQWHRWDALETVRRDTRHAGGRRRRLAERRRTSRSRGGLGADVPSPRFGVKGSSDDDNHITARFKVDGRPIRSTSNSTKTGGSAPSFSVAGGDPDNTGHWGLHPFGGEITEHATFDGVTVPCAGRIGWFYGTDRLSTGEFFRFRLTNLRLVGHDNR